MNAKERYDLLTNKSVKKAICRLAIPTIVSMLITSLYNMADSFFVSSLGSGAIGAVGVIFSLMSLLQAFAFFFGHGSGNYISRKLGSNNIDDCKQMAAAGYYLSIIFGLLCTILGLLFITPLAIFLGSDDLILPYAKIYLLYILLGAPFLCSSLVMNNQLRFQGNAFFAMVGMGIGALLNIFGDAILVPIMGMHGAGLSTFVSQIISFVLLRIGIIKSGNVPIHIKNFKLNKHIVFSIINGGAPNLFRQGLGSVATICLNHVCKQYGTDVVAAMSVVTRITNLPFSIIIGFGQGFQPVCGFNYGAKKYDRVKEGFYFTTLVATTILIVLSIFCYIFAEDLVLLFCKESDNIKDIDLFLNVGVSTLKLHCFTLPTLGMFSPANMMSQTIGKSVRASLLAMSRQGLFFIPSLFILSSSLEGIKFVQPCSDICTLIFSIIVTITIIKELTRKEKDKKWWLNYIFKI